MLYNLQALRAVAALGVVFYHTDFRLAGDWHTEFFGVSTFFVISGFIMCFITKDEAKNFMTSRLVRVAPLYWLCTAALLLVMYQLGIFRAANWTDAPSWAPATLRIEVLRSLLFVPWDRQPMLAVGWTLNFEMYFYAVFAVALWINRRMAPLLAACFIVLVITLNRYGIGGFITEYYSHFYVHYFIVGIAAYYVWLLLNKFPSPLWLGWICAAVILTCYGTQFIQPWWPSSLDAITLLFPAVIVIAALWMECAGLRLSFKPVLLLGNASYAIYLTHTILFEAIRVWKPASFPAPNEHFGVMTLYLAGSIAVGVVVHLWVEVPMVSFIRSRLIARRGTMTIKAAQPQRILQSP